MNAPLHRVTLSGDGAKGLGEALRQGEIGAFKAESDAAACLLPLLDALGWRGGVRQIVETLPHFANTLTIDDLRNVLAALGFRTVRKTVKRGLALDDRLMPCLFEDATGKPLVIHNVNPDGTIRAYDGNMRAEVTLPPGSLEGTLFLVAPAQRTAERKTKLHDNWLAGVFRRFRPQIFRLLGLTLILNSTALAIPLFIMTVYDQVIPSASTRILPMLAMGMALVILIEFVVRHIRARMIAHISGRLEYVITTSVMAQILRLPPSMTESAPLGNQVSRLREFDGIRELFTGPVIGVGLELPFVLLMIGVIAMISGWLALIPLAMLFVYLLIGLVAIPSLRHRVERASKARYERHAFLVETFTNLRTIREAGVERIWSGRFRELNAGSGLAQFSAGQLNQLLQSLSQTVMLTGGLATIGFGVISILAGHMTVGALIATMALIWRVLSPINSLMLTLVRSEQILRAMGQINQLMRLKTECRQASGSSIERFWAGEITFERVSFRYSSGNEPAILGVSFQAQPGEMVAIMGANGAGKSSVLRLILGMYRPQAGQVKMDGLDIRQINPHELRRNIAYVPQQGHMFHGTLEQNLRLSNPAASKWELERAIDLAGLTEEIAAMPEGIHTRIGDQSVWHLNAGFRQRMGIARAYLREAPVILLDEPAQSLDQPGDHALVQALNIIKGKRTVLMVSHRPSHIRICDKVLVLDAGVITASGTPEEMLAQNEKAAP